MEEAQGLVNWKTYKEVTIVCKAEGAPPVLMGLRTEDQTLLKILGLVHGAPCTSMHRAYAESRKKQQGVLRS